MKEQEFRIPIFPFSIQYCILAFASPSTFEKDIIYKMTFFSKAQTHKQCNASYIFRVDRFHNSVYQLIFK